MGLGSHLAMSSGEIASREGRIIAKWINNKIGSGALEVLTDASLVFNLKAGQRVFMQALCYGLETVSDSCTFEIGWCTLANGGGTFHALIPEKLVKTGNTPTGFQDRDCEFPFPVRLSYAKGVRSITFRINTNDAAATVTVGYYGYWETEGV